MYHVSGRALTDCVRYARAVTVGARACMTEDRGRAGFVKDDDDACSPKMSLSVMRSSALRIIRHTHQMCEQVESTTTTAFRRFCHVCVSVRLAVRDAIYYACCARVFVLSALTLFRLLALWLRARIPLHQMVMPFPDLFPNTR